MNLNKFNNYKNQYNKYINQYFKPLLSQENKYFIAEIFFATITLILIIIIIINSPSGGTGLNNAIVGIIANKYPFLEAFWNTTLCGLFEQLNYYLETFIYSLRAIWELILEIFKHEFIPQVALCQEDIPRPQESIFFQINRDDLSEIKRNYCSNLKYDLKNAIDPLNTINIKRIEQFGSNRLSDTWFTTERSELRCFKWYSVKSAWPNVGGVIEIKPVYRGYKCNNSFN